MSEKTNVAENFVGTVQEFADFIGLEYLTTSGLIRVLKDMGKAKETGKRPASGGGRGKPSTIWTVPMKVSLNFAKMAADLKATREAA